MATRKLKAQPTISKAQRNYTVIYHPGGDRTTPSIRLAGDWLRDAGFEIGRHVTVNVLPDCLVIRLDREDEQKLREERQRMQEMEQRMREVLAEYHV